MASLFSHQRPQEGSGAARDIVALGVALATLLLFLKISDGYVLQLGQQLARLGSNNGNIIVGLLLLNVALTIYGWRRYRDAAREVVERTAAEKRANSLASTDPLTGFLNRRSYTQAANDLIARAARQRQSVAMFVIDIDGFKTVNDLHGHLTGDNLLRTAADVIAKALPRDAVTARLGGDEFAAAFSYDSAAPSEADRIADFIVDRLGKPFDLAGVHTHVSASIGVASSGQDCDSVEMLTRRADIAMHAAKKLGRGRYAWFDASMQRELENRNAIEVGLRRGIPAGEFVPYFEQQIDLVTGSLHGFEMLARWEHPERGLVPPAEFIPIAEECGLIGDLSVSVMRQAFEVAKGWDPSLTLSVNISPIQLKDPWLAQKITKVLVETGFPAERLEIEITESSLFECLGLAQTIIASLKNQGVKLALDDFGTGYSSLAHLRALPFDRIKIDRSFVASINENSDSATIVTAITRLAESLGLAVTAEGIEDEIIEARLRTIGTFKGQGYKFGRPVPAVEVDGLLTARGLAAAPRTCAPAEEVEEVRRRA
ncbi:MAG TPA: EAL domain-containing protein [Allosphingosinicella sp.]|nr:EAL domain-containing protein [Allosphingosinicella sp.]